MQLPSLPLPDFVFDAGSYQNYAVIVVGRVFARDVLPTPSRVKAVQTAVDSWARRTGLPLAYVLTSTTENWSIADDDADGQTAIGAIGLVTAFHAFDGGDAEALPVGPEHLDPAWLARIPAELWTDLEQNHGVSFSEPGGVYLVPAGWSIAVLERPDRDGDPLACVSAEWQVTALRLDGEKLAALRSGAPLVLASSHA